MRSLLALAVAALLISLAPVMGDRLSRERAGPVAVVVDSDEVKAMARAARLDVSEVYEALARVGVVGVGLHERTLRDLALDEGFFLASKASLAAANAPIASHLPLDLPDDATLFGWLQPVAPWLEIALESHLPQHADRLALPSEDGSVWILKPTASSGLVGVGFDPDDVETARRAGLRAAPRPWGVLVTDEQAEFRMDQIEAMSPLAVLFWGNEVMRGPGGTGPVIERLRAVGAPIGLVEFSPQTGAEGMAEALDFQAVRVHSVTAQEMASIEVDRALDRWVRAVRERGVRLLYVRLFPSDGHSGPPLHKNLDYLAALVERLKAAGFEVGEPQPINPLPERPWSLLASVAAVAFAVGAVGRRLTARAAAWGWGGGMAAAGIVGFLALMGETTLARQAAALMGAVAFPTLAVIVGARFAERPRGGVAGGAVGGFFAATCVTLVGALVVAALLSDVRFMLKIEEFRGVKAAHILPPLMVGLALSRAFAGARSIREWLAIEIPLWQALLGVAVIGAAAVYVLRTGNQGLAILGVEDAFRHALERWFVARPRTKELLLGHPALLLGMGFLARGDKRFSLPLLVAGAIGQLSIVNTFSHAHSPLVLSMWRTALGVAIGLSIGAAGGAAIAVVRAWLSGRPLGTDSPRRGARP